MKNLPFVSILILVFYLAAFAQTNETPLCPTIALIGPNSIPKPNELISYSVKLDDKAKDLKLGYKWLVSNAEIVEGQATEAIKVKRIQSNSFTVTVEIAGLPQNCSNIVSESAFIDLPPQAVKFGEILGSSTETKKVNSKHKKKVSGKRINH